MLRIARSLAQKGLARTMKLFLTGATGLLGRRLVVDRLSRGDRIVVLSRSADKARSMFAADVNPNVEVMQGDPAIPGPWQRQVDGCDAVINLAGAGVADRRWTKRYKKEIADSRIDGTHQVVNAISEAQCRPGLLINASAVGYYGDTSGQFVDESHPAGTDFLADVCVRWEEQAQLAEAEGARVVMLRSGVVLDNGGGALRQMLTPFRFFVGGPVGLRPYWMSWIHWRDWIELVHMAITDSQISGPLNMTAPNPVTNWQMAREVGATLGRPWWFAAPKPLLRIVLGEFATYIGANQRVIPRKALNQGYTFVFGQLESAMESLLGNGTGAGKPMPVSDRALRAAHPISNESAPIAEPTPSQRVRLLACDVEGALLRSDNSLDPSVSDACRAAQQAGCVVILASGRPPQSLRPIAEAIGITSPVIAFHGALIWNPVESQPQYHEPLNGQLVQEIIDLARTVIPELCIGVETLDRWFTDRVDQNLLDASNVTAPPDEVGPVERHLGHPVTRLSLYGSPAQIERALPVLKQQFWMTRKVALYVLRSTRAQFLHPLADKSIALQRVAARLGAQRSQVMAVGEGLNDAGMIEWAGFGVAVGNACEKVRHLADVTVASNDDAGVAEAIERFVTTLNAS